MSVATSFGDEPGRLRSLLELDVLDSPAELEFDRVVRAAALICGVPISLISLIDRDRQWFKANIGLAGVTETPREFAFCAHTIAERGILEVADASLDARFATNPLVTDEPNIRFYAGATLRLSDGAHVGTLCVIDRVPRVLDSTQRELLELLAKGVVSALEHRQALRSYAESNTAFRAMVDSAPDAMVSVDTNQRVVQFNRAAEKMFACAATDAIGKPLETFIPARFRAAHASHVRAFGQAAGAPRAMHSPGRLLGLRTDGTEFPIEASISQTRVRGKQVFTSVLRDVTERARLEAEVAARSHELHRKNVELSEADQQLRTAQQISKVGSWEFDPATGVVLWSEQLFRIVNVDGQAGAPTFSAQERLYAPESWRRLSEAVRCALATGTPYELELELVRGHGGRRWAVARGEVRVGDMGEVARLVGTLQDVTELKRAHIDLERLSRRLQVATAGAGVGIWEWDLRQNSISWDDQMLRVYGLQRESFHGVYEDWRDAIHPDDVGRVEKAVSEALVGDSTYSSVFRIHAYDGKHRYVHAHGVVERNDSGEPLRMLGTNWDVTEQHEAELAVRANETLLREFVFHAPAAIAMFDRDMRYLQASEQWAQEIGKTVEELLGRPHYELVPGSVALWHEIHQRVLAGEAFQREERAIPGKDGSVGWLQWNARPWNQPDGTIGGLTWFSKNITERKRLEQELQEQKLRLEETGAHLRQTLTLQRAILDASGMSIISTDENGAIEVFNRAAQQLLGYTEAEMLGVSPAAFHKPSEIVSRALELTAETGRTIEPGLEVFMARPRAGQVEQREWTYVRKDGSEFPVLLSVSALHGEQGCVSGFLGVAADMTELGRARDRLEHQKTELERSNEELQQFAYVASHDLQEPLRAVSGCAQILSRTYRGNLDANADQLLTHIVEGAERMRTLIQDLLALSRVTTHARELVRVDCEAACAAALVNLSASIADGGASVDVSTLPTLTGDYGQLVQLFQNLIGNALKYRSSRRPQIQVGCDTSSVEHIFFVRDNGIGIEARYFDRIFSLFQRLHTRSEYAGTGIGLAICKKVVQHHNGRIWLESTPDEGSTFYFSVPREPRRLGL